jgi:WD40 repeat protein
MVIAVLVNQIAPSSRGLRRSGPEEAAEARRNEWLTSEQYDGDCDRNLSTGISERETKSPVQRRPFRAVAALTSLASDLDLISDWFFYRDTIHRDKVHRDIYKGNMSDDSTSLPYLIPPELITLLLVVCVAGTCMWLVLATDGRVLTPVLKRLGIDKVSMGYLLFLSVMVEDLPQVVLTFIICDYYEDDQSLSNIAVVNLSMSVYDTLIKLAEAYDERNDVVETGVWCKMSIWAHSRTVTSVLALPLPPSTKETALSPRPRMTFLQRAMKPVSSTEVPYVRFLTTSTDKTIRLWDTSITMTRMRRKNCVRTFCGHLDAVTCVTLLEKTEGYERTHPDHVDLDARDEEHNHNTFFVTGCRSGNAKLWNLVGDCIRSFYLPSEDTNGITSITTVKKGATFVCGHENGTARLWEAWSGICIGDYKGHSQPVASLCSLHDEIVFLTGSEDETIKLWDTNTAMERLSDYNPLAAQSDDLPSLPPNRRHHGAETALVEEMVCKQSFLGHSGAVVALACMEREHAFVSGSADGTARLWSIRKKFCLRIFTGHHGPILSIASLDQVTFLTGSGDTTVKLWNALSGTCLRTYEGHTDQVTGVTVSEDDMTFMTASADCTVKVWVLTAIPKEEVGGDPDLLDLNDFVCTRG